MTDPRSIELAQPLSPPAPAEIGLLQLATEANEAHRAAGDAWNAAQGPLRVTLANAIQAGRALHEAKRRVKHGQWLPWLAQHCPDISSQRASEYMRLADAYDSNALEIPGSGNVSLSRLVAALPKRRTRGRERAPVQDQQPSDLLTHVLVRLLDLDDVLEARFGPERLPEARVTAVNAFLDELEDPDYEALAPVFDDWAHAILDALE